MRKEKKIWIMAQIFKETHQRFPHISLHKFEVLYHGWRQQGIRKGIHSARFYTLAWQRGWLSRDDAQSFCQYIRSDWVL